MLAVCCDDGADDRVMLAQLTLAKPAIPDGTARLRVSGGRMWVNSCHGEMEGITGHCVCVAVVCTSCSTASDRVLHRSRPWLSWSAAVSKHT